MLSKQRYITLCREIKLMWVWAWARARAQPDQSPGFEETRTSLITVLQVVGVPERTVDSPSGSRAIPRLRVGIVGVCPDPSGWVKRPKLTSESGRGRLRTRSISSTQKLEQSRGGRGRLGETWTASSDQIRQNMKFEGPSSCPHQVA
ncbi:hypothetical protein B0H10DRAFT_977140 [Mycena sp. CBHHK59/15]|nr:hypothetical protein B0H10DRAFT_977140 [Mycena sp. CBHHK59/15]